NSRMDLSVVIPTYRRPDKLAACLEAFARQDIDPRRYQVLVGLDGEDEAGERAAAEAWRRAGAPPEGLRVVVCRRQGYNAVRNRLLELAQGRTLLSVNDDIVPDPGFAQAHRREHERAEREGRVVIVSGYSPWKLPAPDTLLDRLVR